MPSSYSWSTTNTKEAACFASLGFTFSCDITENVLDDNPTGEVLAQWVIHDCNDIAPRLKLTTLVDAWLKGQLPATHPLKWAWRACLNFEEFKSAMKIGKRMRLRHVNDGASSAYVPGDEAPTMKQAETAFQLADINLAMALSVIGVPVIDIEGSGRNTVYTLPQFGHPRKVEEGYETEDAALLAARETPGKLDLVIEATRPDHPVVYAYNALCVWEQLRAHFHQMRKHLLLQFPKWTNRRAIISECASSRVLDRLRVHLKLPGK